SPDTCRPQSRRKGVAKIMNPNVCQVRFATGALPRRVVHAFDAFASIGEHPYGMLSSLRLDNRPRRVIQDHYVRTPRFERLRRNDEYTATELGDRDLS